MKALIGDRDAIVEVVRDNNSQNSNKNHSNSQENQKRE